uniref:Transposase n=1 Tax=Denticeps clupeoides TaxID=299321 RepID=A0AAY4DRN2_9TELE
LKKHVEVSSLKKKVFLLLQLPCFIICFLFVCLLFFFQRMHPRVMHSLPKANTLDHGNEQSGKDTTPLPFKQAILSIPAITQMRVNSLVFDFIVNEVQHFSIVENTSFHKMVKGLSGARTPVCRKTLMKHIEKTFLNMKEAGTEILQHTQNVCTTADIWTAHHRSFNGITCHWMESDTLDRKSAALACERIRGHHTYDVIAAKIIQVHAEFQIQGKVSSTVTDNGKHEELNFFLPPHHQCAMHTLNLIARTDLDKAASQQGVSRKLYRSAMEKCAAIWNKAHRSSGASDIIEEIAQMRFVVPSVTRWRSEYHAIEKLMSLPESQLNEICDQLKVAKLHPQETVFLKEYTAMLKPLAYSVNLHQGEKNCYFGYVIPTLLSLKAKLLEKLTQVHFSTHIILEIIKAIDTRFAAVLASHEARMAHLLNTTGHASSPQVTCSTLDDEVQSSPCLFSHRGLVFTPHCNRMTDKHFEQVLLLRYNHLY